MDTTHIAKVEHRRKRGLLLLIRGSSSTPLERINPSKYRPNHHDEGSRACVALRPASAFGVFFTRPSRMMSKSADKAMVSCRPDALRHGRNNNVICAPKPYQATKSMSWPVRAGATTYLPAGTVHAIGAGSRWSRCSRSDTTLRGRLRERPSSPLSATSTEAC